MRLPLEETVLAKKHDEAARRISRKVGGIYDPKRSPDVRGGVARVEVKSSASEITKALQQLGGGPGRAYVALPASEHAAAQRRLEGLGTGLMDHKGKIVKRSTRKRK